jgi:uncharacterized membrane protein
MKKQLPKWTDEFIENIIGQMLRAGVISAMVIVLAGAVVYLWKYGHTTPSYAIFKGEPAEFRDLSGILAAALDFRGRGLIQLGLLVLIATPVARVIFSVAAFALQRDRLYVLVTLIVLSVLLFSLFGAGVLPTSR